MLSEKVLASIKSITGLSLEEMKKMDIYHEIEYVQKRQERNWYFLPNLMHGKKVEEVH